MTRTEPLILGVEDTLAVASAHGRPEARVTLDACQRHVDTLLKQGLGNLYVLRA